LLLRPLRLLLRGRRPKTQRATATTKAATGYRRYESTLKGGFFDNAHVSTLVLCAEEDRDDAAAKGELIAVECFTFAYRLNWYRGGRLLVQTAADVRSPLPTSTVH